MTTYDQVAWARRLKVKHLESFMVLDEAGTLTEAAARLHILRAKGDDPAAAFLARHSALLDKAAP